MGLVSRMTECGWVEPWQPYGDTDRIGEAFTALTRGGSIVVAWLGYDDWHNEWTYWRDGEPVWPAKIWSNG